MKKFPLLWTLLLPLALFGQNQVSVDIATGSAKASATLDVTKSFDLVFTNLEQLGDHRNIRIDFASISGLDRKVITNPSAPTPITEYDAAARVADMIITLSNEVNESQKFISRFTITPAGKVTVNEPSGENEMVYAPKASGSGIDVPEAYKQHKVVLYDPCKNTYKIWNNGNERKALWKPFWLKSQSTKAGVIFMIRNFNTLKYDITLNSGFVNQHTEMPKLFNTVSTLISSGAKPASATDKDFAKEIYRIAQLNSDLKRLLDSNCLDFEAARNAVRNGASINFANANGILSLDENYNKASDAAITAHKASVTTYDNAALNKEFQTSLHLPVTPDSLVTETIQLYNLLMSTSFEYQSNIIQLENADELQYTLTIAEKKDTKNAAIHLNNQNIRVPILGGIKIDFSTGFYYSDIKNDKYALRDKQINDSTVKKELVEEGSFKGGTPGLAALMHIYPRISKGFNASLTFGLGKALDLNYSVLLGGSLIFGRDNRLVFSGGWNFSNVRVLSQSNYEASGNRMLLPEAATDVKYDNKFKTGAFVSFTYSLLGKKTQAVAGDPDEEEEE